MPPTALICRQYSPPAAGGQAAVCIAGRAEMPDNATFVRRFDDAIAMKFCTAINCMDGRVQLPVIRHLQAKFGADYVDCITDAGPNRVLAECADAGAVDALLARVHISVEKHRSVGIAVAGHHDCAGNPAPKDAQLRHIEAAVRFMQKRYPDLPVVGLWVDEAWRVDEVE